MTSTNGEPTKWLAELANRIFRTEEGQDSVLRKVAGITDRLSVIEQRMNEQRMSEQRMSETEPAVDLQALGRKFYDLARTKGWLQDDRTFGDDCALIASEVSEMLEAFRAGGSPGEIQYEEDIEKPYGIAIEAADILIRLLEFCHRRGIPITRAVEIKHQYNRSREGSRNGRRL